MKKNIQERNCFALGMPTKHTSSIYIQLSHPHPHPSYPRSIPLVEAMEPPCEPLKWTQPLQLPRAGSGEDFLWSQPSSFQDRDWKNENSTFERLQLMTSQIYAVQVSGACLLWLLLLLLLLCFLFFFFFLLLLLLLLLLFLLLILLFAAPAAVALVKYRLIPGIDIP